MKISRFLASLKIRHVRAALRRQGVSRRIVIREPALRSELFSADQMDLHGTVLASRHRVSEQSKPNSLLARLTENKALLEHACELLTVAIRQGRRITPAGEWLLDNYYLIEEQVRTAQKHLPKGYSRELPTLVTGASSGMPRVYDIALETIAHGDGRVDNESLGRFVSSYQTVTPLSLGELWAIPIMLRLALIENLRRVAARVMVERADRDRAAHWADQMTEIAERDPKSVVLAVADMARSDPSMTSSFVAELTRRLQGQGPALALPLNWIEQRLAETGLSVEHLVQMEAQQQAADQVSIGNSIGSLRTLSAMNWREFVEGTSIVERVLREDPAGVYGRMDFATRDRYRHVVERLAKHSPQSEVEIATSALELAQQSQAHDPGSEARSHVGFYLIDDGARTLEQAIATRSSLVQTWQQLITEAPLGLYLGPLMLATILLAWPFLLALHRHGVHDWALAGAAVAVLLTVGQLAVGLVNWLVTLTVRPKILPRMDYAEGLPEHARTLVVVPCMISSAQDVEELVEGLEVRFLANRDKHLHLALLSDFADASEEVLEVDESLLQLARQRIDALNQAYAGEAEDRFFLFHRPRRWNAHDNLWMGYERKRGKLAELNVLLREGAHDRFLLVVGRTEVLPAIRYVITLDTDTQLPRDSAHQFVGAMAHPLNRAVIDPQTRCVVSGHGILQPRVGISLPSAVRSAYARLFGSDAGVDPYTRAVSDVYQDLFGEGSFIGKGIYDVDAFEASMGSRFPDNRILSHDLLEGCYARSGLISDVQLYEEYPSRYSSDVSRRHRWIRGDWQLLPWLLWRVPTPSGRSERNPLSALSRWKIFDNLRRSLVSPALLALLLIGWLAMPRVGWWTIAVLAIVLIPPLLTSLMDVSSKPRDMLLDQHMRVAMRATGQRFLQILVSLAWLPHEALYSLDAIVRTLWRMLRGRQRMLQWNVSRDVERTSPRHLAGLYRLMWIAPALALAVAVVLSYERSMAWFQAAPLLLLWLVSPAIAWRISAPVKHVVFEPSAKDLRFLRHLARKTWAFFEAHVGPQDHWLPPDNMQEQPVAVVAHRTSPTNMGLSLLANLAAFDLGYATIGRLLERTSHALGTMLAMERFRGHFYNWYDTLTLRPLPPCYISSVDSGNLAGHLLTLRTGLLTLADEPVFNVCQLDGLDDTLDLLQEAFAADGAPANALSGLRDAMRLARATPPASLADWKSLSRALLQLAETAGASLDLASGSDSEFWHRALITQCQDTHDFAHQLSEAGHHSATSGIPSLRQLASAVVTTQAALSLPMGATTGHAASLLASIDELASQAGELALMEYDFLYDAKRDLLAIGYNVDDRRLDASFYDLLASEARLASFVAIAQEQLPQDNWFTLGRLLTTAVNQPVLLSWTGSMFEYLMPMLVMPSYGGTLLDQTCRAAVARQIEYGRQLGLPWGVSESGYNTLDANFNYQYRAFGVPGLGLKRGLGEERVVAPYASVMALMVAPSAACSNLRRLTDEGVQGRFGMYEAVDYTASRLPRGQSAALVQSFMAHHQGMSLLALDYVLRDRPMQRRFEDDPSLQATLLLLQERVPRSAVEFVHTTEFPEFDTLAAPQQATLRVFTDPDRARPAVQLLSNGRYHVMVSSAGGGYSRCRDLAVTRWREDITCDNWGMFAYLRDVASGEFWSTTHQPALKAVDHYEAIFSDARAEFRVRQRDIDAHTEIVVSPEDDIELRRTRLTNRGHLRRTIEFTSYAEVVIAPAMSDAMHPAFSNLFVQTELLQSLQSIVCTRRPRSNGEQVPWMCHLMAVHDADIDGISYETDRARFIGRGRSIANPQAMDGDAARDRLSNSDGSVLDPIVAIRCRITLEPGQSALVDMVTGIGDTRDACMHLIEKYRDRRLADRVFNLAWTHSQVLLRQLNASLADAQLYEQMAASIIYASPSMRADGGILRANRRGQSGLWGQSISGDLPIALVHISDLSRIELVRQMVQAHAYWRLKGLAVDLVIWNQDHAGYRQQLQDTIMGLITSGAEASLIDRPGGIFVRSAQQISSEDRILVQAAARLVLSDSRGSLAEQVGRRRVRPRVAALRTTDATDTEVAGAASLEPIPGDLLLTNNYGGFNAEGTEYVITLNEGDITPAPWVNVLANANFGAVVSESGGSYTWAENAHEFRLTPWQNDAVTDASGEAFYLRDEQTGEYWSPTPLPCRGKGPYRIRHAFGYTVFEHVEQGIHSELWVYVALDASVKFSVLKLRNASGRARRLSATGYLEWVMGDLRSRTAMHVVTESDPMTGTLLAHNAYNTEFPGRVAFFDVDNPARTITGDRGEFIGRNGNLRAPDAMASARLSGQVGPGLDPCGAIQIGVDLDDGDEYEVIFRLGVAMDAKAASDMAARFRGLGTAAAALDAVRAHWRWTLGKIQVHTPDPAVNVMANGWLMYQTIACRFLARSGYYQSGGAYGFRDQLQDAMAMVHASPYRVRQHLLLCASHQFLEGDVQHWWHPPMDRGVRTRCSDDYLWLPLATSRYVEVTGDIGVLDETAGYLEGRAVNPDEESYYDLPTRADLQETLYQHCVRAIEHAATRGVHGLPLIGCGDWNDGMNRVGDRGQGESVWLGFFLYDVLQRFAPIARLHEDAAFAAYCEGEAAKLKASIHEHAWDGAWYRRAYFDDGTPLGSLGNDECQIDSIAQSWSVLSGASDQDRSAQAMRSLDERLVRREKGLVQLLDPPFDRSPLDPGYIKGYVPGVRENGGQYTHAAIWAAMAFAEMGDGTRAWELLRMINPVNHGLTAEAIGIYKAEPYVVAADVYAVEPHVGRGGWSWYTGSAGWLYRLIVESLLGLRIEGNRLCMASVLPNEWTSFKLDYRYHETDYHITVRWEAEMDGEALLRLDGKQQPDQCILLIDDGRDHDIDVRYRRASQRLAQASHGEQAADAGT